MFFRLKGFLDIPKVFSSLASLATAELVRSLVGRYDRPGCWDFFFKNAVSGQNEKHIFGGLLSRNKIACWYLKCEFRTDFTTELRAI